MTDKNHAFQIFKRLVNELNMGVLVNDPIAIKGGALHSIWKITTSTGEFVIKKLNPYITAKIDFKQFKPNCELLGASPKEAKEFLQGKSNSPRTNELIQKLRDIGITV